MKSFAKMQDKTISVFLLYFVLF